MTNMATKIFKTGLFLSFALLILLPGCKKVKDPTEGAKLIVDYNLIQTSYSIKFSDAATGSIINDATVNITVTGQDKEDVCDITGVYHSDFEYTSVEGFFGCAVPYNVKPDESDPLQFNLVLECDGYLSSSIPITSIAEGHSIIECKMVNLNNPPAGVMVVSGNYTLSNGALTNDLHLVSGSVPSTGQKASLNIPAGTVLKTGSGSLASGSLNATMVFFSNMYDESLLSIPGGLMASPEGSSEPSLLFSAGFVALELKDASNNEIVSLEGGMASLEMGIAEQTWNPDEGRAVQEGDDIPVWNYNAASGGRKYEDRTVTVSSKAGLMIIYNFADLAWWGFDWWWDGMCWEGSPFIFTSQDYGCDCIFMDAIVREQLSGNNNLLFTQYFYPCLGEEYSLVNVPANLPVSIEYRALCSSTHTTQAVYYYDNLCTEETHTIELISGQNLTDVILDVSAYCPSEPDIVIRPTLGAWFRNINDYCWRWSFMTNGFVHICDVEMGQTYVVGVYYDGQWEEAEVHVTSELYYYNQIELTMDICSNLNY
jgi:hypothetical protein